MRLLEAFSAAAPADVAMTDSSAVKAQRACWWQRGAAAQAIGHSRGGRTTKIHAVCDGVGRLHAFRLSPGNIADITVAPALLDAAPVGRTVLADTGYDATHLRNRIAGGGPTP